MRESHLIGKRRNPKVNREWEEVASATACDFVLSEIGRFNQKEPEANWNIRKALVEFLNWLEEEGAKIG